MSDLFFNTTGETGEELRERRTKATTQESIIYRIFVVQPWRPMTPFDVNRILGDRYPIGSVRRAMTSLSNSGKLDKTGQRKMERYGATNCMWRLAG